MKILAAVLALTLFASAAEQVVGVGLSVKILGDYPVIDALIPGGPAAKDARLQIGDRINAVAQGDGPWEDTTEITLADFIKKVRGRRGTKIRLRAARGKRGKAPKIIIVILAREALNAAP